MIDFNAFFREHQKLLLRYIRRLTRDYHLAEDIAQETFLRAYRSFSARGMPPEPRAWLLRTARHLVIDQGRRRVDSPLDVAILADTVEAPRPPRTHALRLDGEMISKKQLAGAVREGVGALPSHFRRVVERRYDSGKPCWEVALRHGLSPETAKVRLFRGRKELRRRVLSRIRDPQFSSR